jgi:hypothetical protein
VKAKHRELLWLGGLLWLVTRRGPAATGKTKGAPSGKTSAAAPPPSGVPVHPGDQLVPGAGYRATIKLTGIEAMLGTAGAVKSKLEAAGFRGVGVQAKGGGAFEASGTWGGAAVAAKLPPQVVAVWRVSGAAAPPPPPLRAMLYRTPADQYETTRVAVERAPGHMEKRGIFSTPKAAWELVTKSGWSAQPDVQQLEADPT